MNTNTEKLREAVNKVGGQSALARRLTEMTGEKVSQQRVHNWVKFGQAPVHWVPYISMASGVPASSISPVFAVLEQKSA